MRTTDDRLTYYRKMVNHCTSGLICGRCVPAEVHEAFAGSRKQTMAFRGNGWVRLTAYQANNALEVGNRCICCGTQDTEKSQEA